MMTFKLQPDGTVEALNGSRRKVYQWQRTPTHYVAFYMLEMVAGYREARAHAMAFVPVLVEHWRRPTPTITDEEIRTWLAYRRQDVSAREGQQAEVPA